MKTAQAFTNKLAIGLSLACAIHCIALPALLVLLPSMTALQLDNEAFHFWMVAAVVPSSMYALSMGCKQHRRYQLFLWGALGLMLLVLAIILSEDIIGEIGEKILTLIGSCVVALGHWFNYRLCHAQKHNDCACPNEK